MKRTATLPTSGLGRSFLAVLVSASFQAIIPGSTMLGQLSGFESKFDVTRSTAGTIAELPPISPPTSSSAGDNRQLGEARPVLGINSADRDNTPLVTADNRAMFFNSTRFGGRTWAHRSPQRYDDDIYIATQNESHAWNSPVNITQINTSDDDGIAAVSPSGNVIYFLSLRHGWDTDGGPFYQANRNGTSVAGIKGLGGGITQFFHDHRGGIIRIYGASVSADGKDFYFATTIGSRTKDQEIWVAHRDSAEMPFGDPENLGPLVNAGNGSYAPFIAVDNKTLYFASGRPGGLGGDDIYMSVRTSAGWSQPVNLGAPINSADDDAFLSLPASGDHVYFSSTRGGNDDIFEAPLEKQFRPASVMMFNGAVTDGATGQPIEATLSIVDRRSGATLFDGRSNGADGHFVAILHPGGEYTVSISAPGYIYQTEVVATPIGEDHREVVRDYRLQKPRLNQSITLHDVNFDYRSAELRSESSVELDRLIKFMEESPNVSIQVGGHTDSVGSAGFNLELSRQRANTVKQYLIERGGIPGSRITAEGFGGSRPLTQNATEEGRSKNRRVEFTIRKVSSGEQTASGPETK